MATSEIGRVLTLAPGNSKAPPPVIPLSSTSLANTWADKGTMCGDLIFIFPVGTRQMALSKSISDHSACLSSPGRVSLDQVKNVIYETGRFIDALAIEALSRLLAIVYVKKESLRREGRVRA
jgi:hypothetical protein